MAEVNRKWNPYNYVKDDPINRIDPDGMIDMNDFKNADQLADEMHQEKMVENEQKETEALAPYMKAALSYVTSSSPAGVGNNSSGPPGKKQAKKKVTRDQYLAIWGTETSMLENFAGKTQMGNWGKLYYENPVTGRVFMGNQYVKTLGIAKTGKVFGIAGAVVGLGFDFQGYLRYRKNPNAYGAVSGSKFGTDTFMAGMGLTGFGTIPSLLYFGIDAYAPGVMGDFMQDMQKENERHKNDLLWHLH